MEEGNSLEIWSGYVDWRNKPALKSKHGGMVAASFVLAVEVMENMAYLANASNLVRYLVNFMHMSPAKSANAVTNFMGTAFLLSLVGGFLSDAFFTTYQIYLISATIEFLGLGVLTVQALSPALRPATTCDPPLEQCQEVSGAKAGTLFVGLYLVALGVGGIKGSLPVHGAEQFDGTTADGRRKRSTFFNYFVFCLAAGALLAVTLVVWVEDNRGWQWGFGMSMVSVFLSIPVFLAGSSFYRNKVPNGSPLSTIAKVIAAAMFSKSNAIINIQCQKEEHLNQEQEGLQQQKQPPLQFLDRAVKGKPIHNLLHCTVEEVEEVKVVMRILPIFLSTIMLNCCLAQLSTFSVEQAATMDTKVGGLTVPPASLPLFPVLFIMTIAPLYDHVVVPFLRKVRGNEMGISHLQRIGVGLLLSIVAMAVAAFVEIRRKKVVKSHAGAGPLPTTFLWMAFQYLFLGSADLFTLAGLLEFFFIEAPSRMRSLATSLSFASLAMGYYLSSVIVSLVNSSTGNGGHRRPWLAGDDFNEYKLEHFYWLMCVLSGLNYLIFLYWAVRYKYRSIGTA